MQQKCIWENQLNVSRNAILNPNARDSKGECRKRAGTM